MKGEDPFLDALRPSRAPERVTSYPTVPWYPAWKLRKKRAAMTEVGFNRGFRMIAFADEDRFFPHFEMCVDASKQMGEDPAGLKMRDFSAADRRTWDTYAGVDLSSDNRPGNAIFVCSILPDTRYITRSIRVGAWDSPETCWQLQQIDNTFHPRIFAVETNGMQKALIEWAAAAGPKGLYRGGRYHRLTWPNRVRAFVTGRNKADPETGLRGMDILFENLAWLIPMGDLPEAKHQAGCQCDACRWMYELRLYPHAPTTDIVMAMWFAWETSIRNSPYLSMRSDDEDEEPDEDDETASDPDDIMSRFDV